ncbi:MAG: HAD-IIIA family hydrolase [Rikenellaceae bacterium]
MNFKEQLAYVKAFVFDCDGVFTDGSIIAMPDGEGVRTFNAKDGLGVTLALKRGYPLCIISGGVGASVQKRFEHLKVKDVYLNCKNKMATIKEFAAENNLELSEILYMGDDLPDVEVMRNVGVACAPYDAVPEVRHVAHYVSASKGGEGCVRDVIEQVLKAQEKWTVISTEVFSR